MWVPISLQSVKLSSASLFLFLSVSLSSVCLSSPFLPKAIFSENGRKWFRLYYMLRIWLVQMWIMRVWKQKITFAPKLVWNQWEKSFLFSKILPIDRNLLHQSILFRKDVSLSPVFIIASFSYMFLHKNAYWNVEQRLFHVFRKLKCVFFSFFQTSVPNYEDFVSKGAKLHTQLK